MPFAEILKISVRSCGRSIAKNGGFQRRKRLFNGCKAMADTPANGRIISIDERSELSRYFASPRGHLMRRCCPRGRKRLSLWSLVAFHGGFGSIVVRR